MKPILVNDFGAAIFPNGLVRMNYSKHHRTIASIADLKACLRAGKTSDVGGYPLYFETCEGDVYSFEGVKLIWRTLVRDYITGCGPRVVLCDVNWAGHDMVCEMTGEEIPTAYGD